MRKNPFKFGNAVSYPYFTNRSDEIEKVVSVLNSDNHLILFSPRRYGKSSLVFKVTGEQKRPVITLDLQIVTSVHDMAAQFLKRIYRVFPFERVRQCVKNFRVVPVISVNPVTNAVDVTFNPSGDSTAMLEDVLNLPEKLSKKNNRLIVVFVEFQELQNIGPGLFQHFRPVLQHHKKVNYVFLGSQESLIRDIFEKKESPFYHFGLLMNLSKIPHDDFLYYLSTRFEKITDKHQDLSESILDFTGCHPYYTQQLAYMIWEKVDKGLPLNGLIEDTVEELINTRDIDYERMWIGLNRSDKKMLIALSLSDLQPLSDRFLRQFDIGASSTAYSVLKRLSESGFIAKANNKYEIDDPFFKLWIIQRRES